MKPVAMIRLITKCLNHKILPEIGDDDMAKKRTHNEKFENKTWKLNPTLEMQWHLISRYDIYFLLPLTAKPNRAK